MSAGKKETDFPECKGGVFWARKIRTLFRRLDTHGIGALSLNELLDVATSCIASFQDTETYKGDDVVKAVVELWYGHLSTHVEEGMRSGAYLKEAHFVDNIKEKLDKDFKTNFPSLLVKPFFHCADCDNDGKITTVEYRNLMKAWKAPEKESSLMFKFLDADRDGKITLDEFHCGMAEFFFGEDMKSNMKTMWGQLVAYKRPEDYPTLECGPFWEGKMRTMFRRLDVSGHGKLKCHDFIQIAGGISHRGRLDQKKSANVLKALLDIWVKFFAIDKSGRHYAEITEKEFLHNLRNMINEKCFRHEIDQFGWTFFKALELDGNGAISMQEYRNLQESWRVDREEAEAMFKTIDTDKDGRISSDEYLTAWVDYFLGEDHSSPYKSFFGPVVVRHEVL